MSTEPEDTQQPAWTQARPEMLGAAIREIRARRGFSQENVAVRGGLHRNYVGAIERGEVTPTLKVLIKLANGLGVPLSALIVLCEARSAEPDRGRP